MGGNRPKTKASDRVSAPAKTLQKAKLRASASLDRTQEDVPLFVGMAAMVADSNM